MVAKLTRLTHKIVIQVHLVAAPFAVHSRLPVWKLLDTPSYISSAIKFIGDINTFFKCWTSQSFLCAQELDMYGHH